MKKCIFATLVAMALVAPQAGHAVAINTAVLEGGTMELRSPLEQHRMVGPCAINSKQ